MKLIGNWINGRLHNSMPDVFQYRYIYDQELMIVELWQNHFGGRDFGFGVRKQKDLHHYVVLNYFRTEEHLKQRCEEYLKQEGYILGLEKYASLL